MAATSFGGPASTGSAALWSEMLEIGVTLALAEVYRKVEFPNPEEDD